MVGNLSRRHYLFYSVRALESHKAEFGDIVRNIYVFLLILKIHVSTNDEVPENLKQQIKDRGTTVTVSKPKSDRKN